MECFESSNIDSVANEDEEGRRNKRALPPIT